MTLGGREVEAESSAGWINASVIGIALATFFSDVSHEMATAVLPMYLLANGLGPAALGLIEGFADLLSSLAKLFGGFLGHRLQRKKPWAALGYLVTALATSAMGLSAHLGSLLGLRSIAWIGRGFRSPLRDYLLSDAVPATHFGRAYGLERAADMLGAVLGPLLAAAFVWLGYEFRGIILWTIVPGVIAALAMATLAHERVHATTETSSSPIRSSSHADALRAFPKIYWVFLAGVFLFGMGDFSRSFLVWLAASALGETATSTHGMLSIAVLLYTLHNVISAIAAYPIGHWGDRRSKLAVLVAGYSLGALTNVLLAFTSATLAGLVVAIVLSAVYIAVEETLEKATAAQMLPREWRSLGFGVLACVNALGDMLSSVTVGYFLSIGRPEIGFGICAAFGVAGVLWMLLVVVPIALRDNSSGQSGVIR